MRLLRRYFTEEEMELNLKQSEVDSYKRKGITEVIPDMYVTRFELATF